MSDRTCRCACAECDGVCIEWGVLCCERCAHRLARQAARHAQQEVIHGRVVHACPPGDEGLFPCCGKTPFEVPGWHRMTLDPDAVTCEREGS